MPTHATARCTAAHHLRYEPAACALTLHPHHHQPIPYPPRSPRNRRSDPPRHRVVPPKPKWGLRSCGEMGVISVPTRIAYPYPPTQRRSSAASVHPRRRARHAHAHAHTPSPASDVRAATVHGGCYLHLLMAARTCGASRSESAAQRSKWAHRHAPRARARSRCAYSTTRRHKYTVRPHPHPHAPI
ncbi:hypothetical protein FA95DRAFT_94703 [Auriscalpium vulgare]|uniref:Uncharacterized protein n=1 Tax=Auriscalpium vulgare TaxID=40419 RepID=A0ACB8RPY2_9AGAM|nr:hypothetical protein FA95DRAFT_94703 [Auriscalpium vulgare]